MAHTFALNSNPCDSAESKAKTMALCHTAVELVHRKVVFTKTPPHLIASRLTRRLALSTTSRPRQRELTAATTDSTTANEDQEGMSTFTVSVCAMRGGANTPTLRLPQQKYAGGRAKT